jgi:hypothetical protein
MKLINWIKNWWKVGLYLFLTLCYLALFGYVIWLVKDEGLGILYIVGISGNFAGFGFLWGISGLLK